MVTQVGVAQAGGHTAPLSRFSTRLRHPVCLSGQVEKEQLPRRISKECSSHAVKSNEDLRLALSGNAYGGNPSFVLEPRLHDGNLTWIRPQPGPAIFLCSTGITIK